MKWISVKDRLPNTARGTAEQFVVASFVKGAPIECIVICACWYNGKFYNLEYWQTVDVFNISGLEMKTITHWMPLPEPPKQ